MKTILWIKSPQQTGSYRKVAPHFDLKRGNPRTICYKPSILGGLIVTS